MIRVTRLDPSNPKWEGNCSGDADSIAAYGDADLGDGRMCTLITLKAGAGDVYVKEHASTIRALIAGCSVE